ncbi:glycosyltransferase family 92 protein [Simkania sp.]|uniref:glycosyltransferase family 92 protein n=1 Tax=Simkania sp. TaxID=34094 RepID=UPI003B52D086
MFLSLTLFSNEWELVVCTVFKNESEYLEEWLNHNLDLGVEHFFLFDDESSDDFLAVLEPYLADGLITLAPLSMDNPGNHPGCYSGYQLFKINEVMQNCGDRIKWLAAIDIDEYIVPNKHSSLIGYLRDIEKEVPNVGFVSIPWFNFGTSYIEKVPYGQMTNFLTLREAGGGAQTKIIYYVGRTHRSYSHHAASALPGFVPVDARFPEEIQLNHYSLRDMNFVRTVRGPLRNWDNRYPPTQEMLGIWNDVYDDAISRFRGR